MFFCGGSLNFLFISFILKVYNYFIEIIKFSNKILFLKKEVDIYLN